jgi:energy-coupling factor transporter ATP-binding protein EcfA2
MAWISKISITGNAAEKRILLLHGMAGTGKSTIANTIASWYYQLKRLGGSFCFKRGDNERKAENMFSTIARGMADLEEAYRLKLYEVIKSDTLLRTSGVSHSYMRVYKPWSDFFPATPLEQYERLISAPLRALEMIGEIVVVIDALDECDDRSEILAALAMDDLPHNIRLIVTTRPEEDIMRALDSLPHVLSRPLGGSEAGTDADIGLYFKTNLQRIKELDDDDIRELTRKAGSLFQWASTTCLYLAGDPARPGEQQVGADIRARLETILLADDGLDGIYHGILKKMLSPNASERASVLRVLVKILATSIPLPLLTLKALCIDEKERNLIDRDISKLGSLLDIHSSNGVRPIHTSFRDYLTNLNRSKEFFVDLHQGHCDLAIATLTTMNRELHFHMFDLPTSHQDITAILDNDPLRLLGSALYYSCRYWMIHLKALDNSSGIHIIEQVN